MVHHFMVRCIYNGAPSNSVSVRLLWSSTLVVSRHAQRAQVSPAEDHLVATAGVDEVRVHEVKVSKARSTGEIQVAPYNGAPYHGALIYIMVFHNVDARDGPADDLLHELADARRLEPPRPAAEFRGPRARPRAALSNSHAEQQ